MDVLRVGQVWVVGVVGAVPPLMCVIGQLDDFPESPKGQIVSLSVIPHPDAQEAGWPIVSHMPFFEEAFRTSGLKLEQEGIRVGEGFDEGYTHWREAFDVGNAGAFDMNVSEAYEGVVSVTDQ